MRTTPTLDALLPRLRQRLLAATALQPERWWYLSDLARELRVRPSSVQRHLAALSQAGILRRKRDGNRVYYSADPECPILPELQRMLEKTSGLVDVLRAAFAPVAPRIRVAFVHGSIARSAETSASDVDLIVVGEAGLADLALPLREARSRLGREVNTLVYRPEEFAAKLRAPGSALGKILDRELLFVIGSRDELERLARREKGGRRTRIARGDRRVA